MNPTYPLSRPLSFGLSSAPAAPGAGGGVPPYITIGGVLYQLLLGFDSRPLIGFDGQYLYGEPR